MSAKRVKGEIATNKKQVKKKNFHKHILSDAGKVISRNISE